MSAFRSQQHRWAKGALQTARKLLPSVLRAPLPWATKLEAFVHLTAYVTYPLLLLLACLLAPLLAGPRAPALAGWVPLQLAIVGVGTLPVALFLALGQWRAGRRGARVLTDTALALVLCGGLCWHLARAVAEGLHGARGEFVRTWKSGRTRDGIAHASAPPLAAVSAARHAGVPEQLFACAFALLALGACLGGRPAAAPFLVGLAAGLAWVGLAAGRDAARARRLTA